MIHTVPDYYESFKCIAGECPDTCCSGWQIVINEEYLEKYSSCENFPTIDMRNYVDFAEGVFRQAEDRRCSFLRDDNLCKLCYEYGEEALCKTCHLYPRHIEEFENVRETTLSISCPEVARIILTRKDPVQFISTEDDVEEEYEDFDFMLYSGLCDTRDVMLRILQNRKLKFDVRAAMVLGLSSDINKRLNDGRFFTIQNLLEYVETERAYKKSRKKVKKFKEDKERVYNFMYKKYKKLFTLEPISYDWINLYTETEHILYKDGVERYTEISEKFDKYMSDKERGFKIMLEQLLVYFVSTYFCGAVYDGAVFGKGKLCVYSVYLIREFLKAAFVRNNYELSDEEIQDIVLRYSRELEHSDVNLDRFEKF